MKRRVVHTKRSRNKPLTKARHRTSSTAQKKQHHTDRDAAQNHDTTKHAAFEHFSRLL
jgi:hypothetical protein